MAHDYDDLFAKYAIQLKLLTPAPARRSLRAVGPARPSGKAEGERAPARRGLSSPAGGAPSRSTAPAAKGNSKLFIILGGAAVVLIAVVAWVALGGKKKEPPM